MAFQPLEPTTFAALEGFLLPDHLPPLPDTLHPVDTLLLKLVRQAVFSPALDLLTEPGGLPASQA